MPLTLNLLTTTIVAPPSNASKWQMGFNSAFKGLITILFHKLFHTILYQLNISHIRALKVYFSLHNMTNIHTCLYCTNELLLLVGRYTALYLLGVLFGFIMKFVFVLYVESNSRLKTIYKVSHTHRSLRRQGIYALFQGAEFPNVLTSNFFYFRHKEMFLCISSCKKTVLNKRQHLLASYI